MRSTSIKLSSRVVVSAIVFILISLPAVSYAGKGSPTAILDYGLDPFEDDRFENSETALLNLLRSSSFRRLDTSQRALVYSHIAYNKINRGKDKESIQYIDKALSESKKEFGERSIPYLSHLRTKAIALYWSDKRRQALRITDTILDHLDRMDGDYREEKRRIRVLAANMRRVGLKEVELPLDLSDFYTDCESMSGEKYLARVDSIMHDYQQIGRDIRPDRKQAQYFKNTYITNARESTKDRKSRIIYVPDDEHMDDWCVIYPDKSHIDRVIVSASNDR